MMGLPSQPPLRGKPAPAKSPHSTLRGPRGSGSQVPHQPPSPRKEGASKEFPFHSTGATGFGIAGPTSAPLSSKRRRQQRVPIPLCARARLLDRPSGYLCARPFYPVLVLRSSFRPCGRPLTPWSSCGRLFPPVVVLLTPWSSPRQLHHVRVPRRQDPPACPPCLRVPLRLPLSARVGVSVILISAHQMYLGATGFGGTEMMGSDLFAGALATGWSP